jgi:hypothetical protein
MKILTSKEISCILISFSAFVAFYSSVADENKLEEFKPCESKVIGKTYKDMSGPSYLSDVYFLVSYKYIGEENYDEMYQVSIDVDKKFTYVIGKYPGCGLDGTIEYVWVDRVPNGYKIFWRISHTGQAVPEDYQGVILSNEGKFIEKYHHEI